MLNCTSYVYIHDLGLRQRERKTGHQWWPLMRGPDGCGRHSRKSSLVSQSRPLLFTHLKSKEREVWISRAFPRIRDVHVESGELFNNVSSRLQWTFPKLFLPIISHIVIVLIVQQSAQVNILFFGRAKLAKNWPALKCSCSQCLTSRNVKCTISIWVRIWRRLHEKEEGSWSISS